MQVRRILKHISPSQRKEAVHWIKSNKNVSAQDAQDISEYLVAAKEHQELLKRYMTPQMDQQELMQRTANRVGLNLPKAPMFTDK